jgi:hypothetical protein
VIVTMIINALGEFGMPLLRNVFELAQTNQYLLCAAFSRSSSNLLYQSRNSISVLGDGDAGCSSRLEACDDLELFLVFGTVSNDFTLRTTVALGGPGAKICCSSALLWAE